MALAVTMGERVRLLRTAQRLTQEALAGRAGIETVTLTNIEGGKQRPREGTERIIAEALHVTRKALLDDETCILELAALVGVKVYAGPMAPVQEFANLFQRMAPAHAEAVLHFAKAFVGLDDRTQEQRDRDVTDEPQREKARKQLERRYKNKNRKQ